MGCNYAHKKLNHSKEFVRMEENGNKVHTNTIESNWCGAKKQIPVSKRNGPDLQDCLFEFMWRRANAGNLWKGLYGLAKVRYAVAELLRVDEVDEPWEPTDLLINIDDCVDYDSAATEETESDDEVIIGGGVDGGQERRAVASAPQNHHGVARMPVAEAVPSAEFYAREQAAVNEQQMLADVALGSDSREYETPDGVRRLI